MELIFLHGPPAVGKLTVAQALMAALDARMSDNHATIDLARMVLDFGAPGFWDLVHKLRLNLLDAVAASGTPYFITTACYHTGDTALIKDWDAILQRHGARMLPVHLVCTPAVQSNRVLRPDRRIRRKLNTVEGLDRYMAKNDYAPLPRENCLIVDTSHLPAKEVAGQIIRHFDLSSPASLRRSKDPAKSAPL